MNLLEELRELRIAHALLEEQLKEARDIIDVCGVLYKSISCKEYLEKYKEES